MDILMIGSEHHHLRAWTDLLDTPGCFHPVHARHDEIQQNNIGNVLRDQLERFLTRGCLPNDVELCQCFEIGTDTVPHYLVIIHNQYAHVVIIMMIVTCHYRLLLLLALGPGALCHARARSGSVPCRGYCLSAHGSSAI